MLTHANQKFLVLKSVASNWRASFTVEVIFLRHCDITTRARPHWQWLSYILAICRTTSYDWVNNILNTLVASTVCLVNQTLIPRVIIIIIPFFATPPNNQSDDRDSGNKSNNWNVDFFPPICNKKNDYCYA